MNSQHVLKGEVQLDRNNCTVFYRAKDLQITKGDVLINGTGVGTIGRSAPYLHDQKALPDNHVTILRIKDSEFLDPVYLSVFLNCLTGKCQVEKRIHGSSGQIELYPADIDRFIVWIAPRNLQALNRGHVINAYEAKNKTKILLEGGKRAVEIAIEESEGATMSFLAELETEVG